MPCLGLASGTRTNESPTNLPDTHVFDSDQLARVLSRDFSLAPGAKIYVAYSGGPDSTALLHALIETRRYHVIAAYAHHGHEAADHWLQHCLDNCNAWQVKCVSETLMVTQDGVSSWEASARAARYTWLASLLTDDDVLATAHHLQDQAETVLAHLLRGAGVTGLSGIPAQRPLGRGTLIRPLLQFTPESLRDYLRERELGWIDDPSNRDFRYTRNRIRGTVLPVLQTYWPGVRATLAATAVRMRETDELLLDVGAMDLAKLGAGNGPVSVTGLRRLNQARQANLLRTWVRRQGLRLPPHKRLDQVLKHLVSGEPEPTAQVAWDATSIRRYRDGLFLVPILPDTSALRFEWDLSAPLDLGPLGVTLQARPASGRGLAKDRVRGPVTIRWRQGGERCRLPGRTHRHRLKKMLQDKGVPPWQRSQIPLLFCGDELAAVVGYWYCAPFAADSGEAGIELLLSKA